MMNEIEPLEGPLDVTALIIQPMLDVHPSTDVEAVVAGHIGLDIIPSLVGSSVAIVPGRLIDAGHAHLVTSGPVAHTGLALHKLGINTRLIGKVGDDLFGQGIIQGIEAFGQGLSSGMIITPGETSPYSIILRPPKTERIVIHDPAGNNTFRAEDVPYALLETISLFHFSYPALMVRMYQNNGAEMVELLQRAKACGVTTSLDFSLPRPLNVVDQTDWSAVLAAVLPSVDVFLTSIEELLFLLRRPLFDKLSAKVANGALLDLVTPDVVSELGTILLGMGAKIVGLKMGHRGFYLCTTNIDALEQSGRARPTKLSAWANRELWAPCFVAQVVDSVGSGDATVAGFLFGLMRGMSPEAALSAACAVGACNVEATNALSGIKSWPATLERIAAGWPRLMLSGKNRSALDMPSFGWRWQETQEVWLGRRDPHH